MLNLRFAFRTLFKTPFVTTVAIVSLAFGIGANSAIFSVFNQVLLRPLPVAQPRQLVNFLAPGPKPGSQSCGQAGDCDAVFSYLMFRDLEREQKVFTGIAAHVLFGANLSYKGQTLSSEGVLVSGSYFSVLGLRPAAGRLLDMNDDRVLDESHVAVLAYDYWRTRFGANLSVVGDVIIVNGQTLTIVGVAPEGFTGTTLGTRPLVFVPISMRAKMSPGFKAFDNRRSYWAYLFARLKPGVTLADATTAMNAPYHNIVNDVEAPLQKGMSEQTMARFRKKELQLEAGAHGQSSTPKEAWIPLLMLMIVTGIVLLIACANIANLLLARSAARANEMAIRLSIGANRRQLIRQLLVESCLLAVMGGIGGLLVARVTLALMASLMPSDATEALSFAIDPMIAAFAGGLSLVTGFLFGLFPALHSTRPDLASTLKGTAGQPSGARSAKWFRLTLATAQISLSLMLLVAAGLFIRSLANVSRVELGVKIEQLVTFGISPELNGYTPERSRVLFEQAEEQLAAIPGVTGATAALVPLMAGDNWGSSVLVEGFPSGPDVDNGSRYNEVGPGYFKTVGNPLIAGREFTNADRLDGIKVVIVNEAFARKFKLGTNAVGKRMTTESGKDTKLDTEIIGLARDAKYSDVKQQVPPIFFAPYKQDKTVGAINFYVRTAGDPGQLLIEIPKVIKRLDPNLPIDNLRTMPQQIKENVFLDRLISTLSAAFAILATLLAAVGLYGVLAYTVSQRTREFGLRMALGADPARVLRLVLGQVGWMVLAGGGLGLVLVAWLASYAESLLFELKGRDPSVFVAATVLLVAVALVAGFIPARRASKLDPMKALRYE
jgi:predicted permease